VSDSITLGRDGLYVVAALAKEDGNIMCPPSSLRAPNTTDRQLVMYPFVAPDSSFAVLFPGRLEQRTIPREHNTEVIGHLSIASSASAIGRLLEASVQKERFRSISG
jgi:hypothetical protein